MSRKLPVFLALALAGLMPVWAYSHPSRAGEGRADQPVGTSCDTTLTVGAGTGIVGSTGNTVGVSLTNNQPVKGVQFDIVDAPDVLTLTGCTSLVPDFGCSTGPITVLFVDVFGGSTIPSGANTPILALKFDVHAGTAVGNVDLQLQAVEVSDQNNQPCGVLPITGSFDVLCGTNADCDDGNVCTDDTCSLGVCDHTGNANPCDDLDACTTVDTCADGLCLGGSPPNCDDGSVCTDDSCDSALGCQNMNNTALCDDGDACTTGDTCDGGACFGGPPPNCDDGNACTDDLCDAEIGCFSTDNSASCNDGDICTDDSCDPVLGCQNTDNTASCSDGDPCTMNDACSGGSCVGGPTTNCDDGNVCTEDSCDSVVGCRNVNNTASCDDGDACTTGDTCIGGGCFGGPPPDCDDDNVCTDDSCESASGCVHSNNADPCNDPNFCNGAETCSGGICLSGSDPCPGLLCDEVQDICMNCFVDADCDNGNACDGTETCIESSCQGGTPLDCDDANVCTDDSCDPSSGCANTVNSAPCNDGDACTTNDSCDAGVCVGGPPPNCDDSNVCTNDDCNPALGCQNVNNTAVCDDGDACTTDDACGAGACQGGPPPNCDDGNVCTDDSCDTASGCMNVNNTSACHDGDPCTTGDTCTGGACVGGPPPDCDDANVCTDDECAAGIGCVNADNTAACDDGDLCTEGDVCVNAVCNGSPVDCSTLDDECHVGTCNQATGNCEAEIIGTPDDDGDQFSPCQGDCDDTSDKVYPGAAQICDGMNNDCDDPEWPAVPAEEADDDDDTFAECGGDCNDEDPAVHPHAIEICNGIDDDCNTLTDEDAAGEDTDGDGVHNLCDNCPAVFNPTQADTDSDLLGNGCDNCVFDANPDQADRDFDGRGDRCDNCVDTFNPSQDDLENDGKGDACDNCFEKFNPSQSDVDDDFEGDPCDLDDGLIYVTFKRKIRVRWQEEIGFDSWNAYQGDLDVLKSDRIYTQAPGSYELAWQTCGLGYGGAVIGDPDPGKVAFFLVTGSSGGAESNLGTDSFGAQRPNDNSCP